MNGTRIAALAALLLACAPLARAAEPSCIRGEMLASIADVRHKVMTLAQAMPDRKFSWRPERGVRSVSEVYLHMAGANFMYPSYAGVKPPDDVGPDMEQRITAKAEVIATLDRSFDHLVRAIASTPEPELDRKVTSFMGEVTVRALYLAAVTHLHEHLGQAIAYARMNHVTPPWTAADQAADRALRQGKLDTAPPGGARGFK